MPTCAMRRKVDGGGGGWVTRTIVAAWDDARPQGAGYRMKSR